MLQRLLLRTLIISADPPIPHTITRSGTMAQSRDQRTRDTRVLRQLATARL
jgi:hypothetical protein